MLAVLCGGEEEFELSLESCSVGTSACKTLLPPGPTLLVLTPKEGVGWG